MRKVCRLAVVAGGILFLCAAPSASLRAGAEAITVEATDISDGKYFESALSEINKAKSEIVMVMYSLYARAGEEKQGPGRLLEALLEAQRRGVKVKAYLDRSYIGDEERGRMSSSNDYSYSVLKAGGAEVYFTKPQRKTHDKLIVIDRETVIDGSTNWTTKALTSNSESANILRSAEYAKVKLDKISRLEVAEEAEVDEARARTIRVPNEFITNRRLAPDMVTASSGSTFDIYLALLRERGRQNGNEFTVKHSDVAGWIGKDTKMVNYRGHIDWAFRRLRDRYRLVDFHKTPEMDLKVRVLRADGSGKEYTEPESGYFNLQEAYWAYGWDRKLSLRAKFAYIVCVYEAEISSKKPWWSNSHKGLSWKYGPDAWTFSYALRELRKANLLEVEHSRVEGAAYEERGANRYRLKPLLSNEEIEKIWQDMAGAQGREKVEFARGLAGMLDEGNNPEAVRDFIRVIGRYGEEPTRRATAETARMGADNPLRRINYVVGILQRYEREGRQ